MSITVKVTLNPVDKIYDVYSGDTSNQINTLVCQSVIDTCEFDIPDTYLKQFIWVKLTTDNCDDKIYRVVVDRIL